MKKHIVFELQFCAGINEQQSSLKGLYVMTLPADPMIKTVVKAKFVRLLTFNFSISGPLSLLLM